MACGGCAKRIKKEETQPTPMVLEPKEQTPITPIGEVVSTEPNVPETLEPVNIPEQNKH